MIFWGIYFGYDEMVVGGDLGLEVDERYYIFFKVYVGNNVGRRRMKANHLLVRTYILLVIS